MNEEFYEKVFKHKQSGIIKQQINIDKINEFVEVLR